MQPCLTITPSGHLYVDDGSATEPVLAEATGVAARRAFDQSSADGLLLLATGEFDKDLQRILSSGEGSHAISFSVFVAWATRRFSNGKHCLSPSKTNWRGWRPFAADAGA